MIPALCPRCGSPVALDSWAKPIPDRRFDFEAHCSDLCDEEGPVGYGATETAALADWGDVADTWND